MYQINNEHNSVRCAATESVIHSASCPFTKSGTRLIFSGLGNKNTRDTEQS